MEFKTKSEIDEIKKLKLLTINISNVIITYHAKLISNDDILNEIIMNNDSILFCKNFEFVNYNKSIYDFFNKHQYDPSIKISHSKIKIKLVPESQMYKKEDDTKENIKDKIDNIYKGIQLFDNQIDDYHKSIFTKIVNWYMKHKHNKYFINCVIYVLDKCKYTILDDINLNIYRYKFKSVYNEIINNNDFKELSQIISEYTFKSKLNFNDLWEYLMNLNIYGLSIAIIIPRLHRLKH